MLIFRSMCGNAASEEQKMLTKPKNGRFEWLQCNKIFNVNCTGSFVHFFHTKVHRITNNVLRNFTTPRATHAQIG